MLARESWLPQAEELPLGGKARLAHDCGVGRVLLVEHTAEGYKAWCHRCNDRGWAPRPELSFAERMALLRSRAGADNAARGQDAPHPRIYDLDEWPLDAKAWLYKAGLGRPDVGRLGAYYHPHTNRVVLPVLASDSGILYWQARSIDGRTPKYLGPNVKPASLLARWGRANSPTLCEDILSAFKVGLVAEGWAVLGTHVQDNMVAALLDRQAPVNVWLDPDPAGQRGAGKIIKQLRAYGLAVRNIVSPKDPKLMHRAQIKELLT